MALRDRNRLCLRATRAPGVRVDPCEEGDASQGKQPLRSRTFALEARRLGPEVGCGGGGGANQKATATTRAANRLTDPRACGRRSRRRRPKRAVSALPSPWSAAAPTTSRACDQRPWRRHPEPVVSGHGGTSQACCPLPRVLPPSQACGQRPRPRSPKRAATPPKPVVSGLACAYQSLR